MTSTERDTYLERIDANPMAPQADIKAETGIKPKELILDQIQKSADGIVNLKRAFPKKEGFGGLT